MDATEPLGSPDIDHSHSHGHSHGMEGGWDIWRRQRTLQVVLAGVCLAAIATCIGVFVLWPDGSGRPEVEEQAIDYSLEWQPVLAEVTRLIDKQCTFSDPDAPQQCRTFTAKTIEDYIPKTKQGEEGPDRSNIVPAGKVEVFPEKPIQSFKAPDFNVGDTIVLGYDGESFFYADLERRSSLLLLTVLFIVVVLALSRFRGLTALLAMGVTVVI